MASSENESESGAGDVVTVIPSQLASETPRSSQNQNLGGEDPLQNENEQGGGVGEVFVPEEEIEVDADLVRVSKTKRDQIKVFFEGYG